MRRKIIVLVIILFMSLSCDTRDNEIIVAPHNFTGYIIVIFNQENGNPVKYHEKKRVYMIPSNGILKTQFKTNSGWGDNPEFYYKKINPEYEIPSNIFFEIESLPADTIVGFKGATGSIKKADYNDQQIKYSIYYIGTRLDIKHAKEEVEKLDIVRLIK